MTFYRFSVQKQQLKVRKISYILQKNEFLSTTAKN